MNWLKKLVRTLIGGSSDTSKSETLVSNPASNTVKERPACGCGRSPSGYCVGLHNLSEEEWATSHHNPNAVHNSSTEKVSKVTKKKAPIKKVTKKLVKPVVKDNSTTSDNSTKVKKPVKKKTEL